MFSNDNGIKYKFDKLNEVINNIRFVLNLGGNKCDERKRLNSLAKDIDDFIIKNCYEKDVLHMGFNNFSESKYDYLELCNRLYNELNWIYLHREFIYGGSILKQEINEKKSYLNNKSVLQYYSDLISNNEITFDKLSTWLRVLLFIEGGNCSVWGEKIKKAVSKLYQLRIDDKDWEEKNEKLNLINSSCKLIF